MGEGETSEEADTLAEIDGLPDAEALGKLVPDTDVLPVVEVVTEILDEADPLAEPVIEFDTEVVPDWEGQGELEPIPDTV